MDEMPTFNSATERILGIIEFAERLETMKRALSRTVKKGKIPMKRAKMAAKSRKTRQSRASPKLDELTTVETVPYLPGRRIASSMVTNVAIPATNARF